SEPSTAPVTVNFSTADGTATATTNYTAASSTVTFPPGITSRTVLVRTSNNTLVQGNTTFFENVSNPIGATISRAQGVATITDDVFKYTGAASRLSGSQSAASSFVLNSADTTPKGIVTDGGSLWIVDDGSSTDTVFKYSLGGSSLGSWTIDAANTHPTGLT